MGYSQAPAFAAVVVLMVFTAANPVADAQFPLPNLPLPPLPNLPLPPLPNLPLPNLLNVSGILNCPSGTGLPLGPGIPGVTVKLNCTILGVNVTLGQGVTGVNGIFNISVRNVVGILPIIAGPLIPCSVYAQLPLNSTVCPILNTATGILYAVPTLLGTILSPIFGLIINLLANTFVMGSVGTGV